MKQTFQLLYSNQTIFDHTADHLSHVDLEPILHIENWAIHPDEHWAVVGGSEKQRSAILNLLSQSAEKNHPSLSFAEVSLREQQRLIDEEIVKNKTGVADEIVHGSRVGDILKENALNNTRSSRRTELVTALGFESCLDKYFRQLSSGETRRLLLINALQHNIDLLLLHDPFEGLDAEIRPVASQLLLQSLGNKQPDKSSCTHAATSVFIASRPEQLLACATHIAYIDGKQLKTMTLESSSEQSLRNHLQDISHIIQPQIDIQIPSLPEDHPYHKHSPLNPDAPLVDIVDASVQYSDLEKPVFEHLNWKVLPGEHWRITGPNGSGKSTLLKLISGDHPQVYRNHIEVCGFKRGSGESVWEVKRHIGYMGGEMLWNYRSSGQLAGKALDVVMSGLYDSIGLYTKINNADRQIARAWLQLFEMGASERRRFPSLGLAEQRLVLIARAMIKRPALLILDEPLQGLDGEDRTRVLKIVEKLISASATTLLYVSHHEDELVTGITRTLSLAN